jgi:hypothetical protein
MTWRSPGTSQRLASSEDTDLAYILAASYSGSTLLAMLLGSQPEACTVGEMRVPSIDAPDRYLCSCGDQIQRCRFWALVSDRMKARGFSGFDITTARLSIHAVDNTYAHRLLDPLPRGPLLEGIRETALRLSPAWPAQLRDIQHRNGALVDVLREITGTKVVIDSSKIALHLNYLLKTPGLRVKVIQLVRDGRAVAISMIGHGLKRPTPRETMAAAALSWRRNNEAGEHILARLPASQWLHVRYEELCREPEETLRNICRFVGIASRDLVLDFRSKQQHVLGNEMRLASTSAIRVDDRWRSKLTKEDLGVFNEVAGEMNRKYGYS